MSEFIVKPNAWHLKYIAWYNSIKYLKYSRDTSTENWYLEQYYVDLPSNFCQYWRAVLLWPTIRFAAAIALDLVFLTIAYHLCIVIFSSFAFLIVPGSFLIAAALLLGGAAIFFGVNKLLTSTAENITKSPGLTGTLYRSYKEKYCPGVVYKDEDNAE